MIIIVLLLHVKRFIQITRKHLQPNWLGWLCHEWINHQPIYTLSHPSKVTRRWRVKISSVINHKCWSVFQDCMVTMNLAKYIHIMSNL